jgi:hypothetical protein
MTPAVVVTCEHWLPTDPPRPCPDLLTAEEAVVFLRLDKSGVKHPTRSFHGYREQGLIRGVMIGRHLLYERRELLKFIERKREQDWR